MGPWGLRDKYEPPYVIVSVSYIEQHVLASVVCCFMIVVLFHFRAAHFVITETRSIHSGHIAVAVNKTATSSPWRNLLRVDESDISNWPEYGSFVCKAGRPANQSFAYWHIYPYRDVLTSK